MTRVAIVTGGTRGIGRAICERLRDEREFTVIANYAGNDDAARKFTDETGIATIKFDVGDFDAVQDACGKVAEEHGPIDVVVNTKRTQAFHPDCFAQAGLDPRRRRVLIVKSSQHFNAGFGPIAREVMWVATPGTVSMDFAAVNAKHKRVSRALWPHVANPHE